MQSKEQTKLTYIAGRWTELSAKIAALVAELPDDKVDWTPSAGVRSYGSVLRHMAFWNRYVAATLRAQPAEDQANELPNQKYGTKTLALDAFNSASSDVVDAMDTASRTELIEVVLPFLEHNAEHYGQLSVYARLLSIVPPASRG